MTEMHASLDDAGLAGVYLPEIHDLAPGVADLADRMTAAFPRAARDRIARLIVPNWQGVQPLEAAPAFSARLRGMGGTPVLHGWTHSKGPDALNWLLYGHDDRSEFARLDADETADRLDRGIAMCRAALGGVPRWFCAPRWQGNPHLEAALAARGFRGVMTRGAIVEFGQPPVPIPALNFDEGARWFKIAPGLALRGMAIRRLLHTRRPFRLVLHPDDLSRPATFAQFRAVAARLEADGWQPVSLDALPDRARGRA